MFHQGAFLPESAIELSPERLLIAVRHDEEPFNLSKIDLWQVGVVPPDLFGIFSTKPTALR